MKRIEYLPTGHIIEVPDENADNLIKKFPENYKILDSFIRCEFVNECDAQCDGAIENTETCDSYQLHLKIKALKEHEQQMLDHHSEYVNMHCREGMLLGDICRYCEEQPKSNYTAARILEMIKEVEKECFEGKEIIKEL